MSAKTAATPKVSVLPRLDTANTPRMTPTGITSTGPPSPNLQSPEARSGSPGLSPQGQGPGLALGDTILGADFLSVKDSNILSSSDFVTHHNQALFFGLMDRQAKAMEAMAGSKKYAPVVPPKIGECTAEELATHDKLLNENKSLIKKALEAYGNDLKPKRLTSKAGEKLNEQAVEFRQRLIESAPIGSGGVEAKTRVEELFDELTEAGVRIFFRNMVNLFIPSTVAAGKTSGPTYTESDQAVVDFIMTDPQRAVLDDGYVKYVGTLGGAAKVVVSKVKGLAQAKQMVEQLESASGGGDDDDMGETEQSTSIAKNIATQMTTMSDAGILDLWKEMAKQHKPAAKKGSGKTTGAKRSKADAAADGDSDEEDEDMFDPSSVSRGSPHKKRA